MTIQSNIEQIEQIKTIGIIGAMEQEVEILKSQLKSMQTKIIAHCIFYIGEFEGKNIVLAQSGIGKVASATTTALLIQNYNPNFIINTGSAGGLSSNLKVGDIVISDECSFYDVDVTNFGYKVGQVPQMPATYEADKNLVAKTLNVISTIDRAKYNILTGLIISGDSFVRTPEQRDYIKTHFPDAIAVEMEAGSIAQTCHLFKTPFIVIRAISDTADAESTISFDEFLPIASKNSSVIVQALISKL